MLWMKRKSQNEGMLSHRDCMFHGAAQSGECEGSMILTAQDKTGKRWALCGKHRTRSI